MKLQDKFEKHFAGKNKATTMMLVSIASFLAKNIWAMEKFLDNARKSGTDNIKYDLLAEKLFKEEQICTPAGEMLDGKDLRNLLIVVRKELEAERLAAEEEESKLVLKLYNPNDFEGEGCSADKEFLASLKERMSE